MDTIERILSTDGTPQWVSQWGVPPQYGTPPSGEARQAADTAAEEAPAGGKSLPVGRQVAAAPSAGRQTTGGQPAGGGQGGGGGMTYTDLFLELNPYAPPTKEDIEKERKKRRREQIFNAIGDGIQALSNLYFTTQYAPNMYNPQNSLTGKARERWDRMDAKLKADREEWYNGYVQAFKDDRDADAAARKWENQLAQQDFENALKRAADERAQKLYDLKVKLQNQQIDAAEADAAKKKIEADYAGKVQEAKLETEKARKSSYEASAGASRARAAKTRQDIRDAGGKFTLRIGGKTHTYKSREDYERAVYGYAKKKGISEREDYDGYDSYGGSVKRNKAKDINALAAEVEEAYSTTGGGKPQGGFNKDKYRRGNTKAPLN